MQVAIYPGNVIALHVSKRQGFKYISGQYIYVNCPDVSPFEWYIYNLSSTIPILVTIITIHTISGVAT